MTYTPQVERLKRDSRELEYFIRKMEKQGNSEKAFIIQKKLSYLQSKIDEMEETLVDYSLC